VAQEVVIKASEGHRAFGKLLRRVYRSDDRLIVERDGFPVAVLMSYQEYQRIKRAQALEAFERFSRPLGRDIEQQGLAEDALLAELKASREEVFGEQYAGPAQ
jgi:prevent-host-death family protein